MARVRQLDHLAITVTDLERSVRFYKDLLGLREVERHCLDDERISTLVAQSGVVLTVVRLQSPDTPEVLLDLQQYVSPPASLSNAALGMANHGHFCFRVDDLDRTHRELGARGVEFVSEPVVFDLPEEVVKVVFLKDPDGMILELVERGKSLHA
jgi:glyoxylase I family protein